MGSIFARALPFPRQRVFEHDIVDEQYGDCSSIDFLRRWRASLICLLGLRRRWEVYDRGCTSADAALPRYSTVASDCGVGAIPVPCPSLTITTRNVLSCSIPWKLPWRSPIVNVRALSSQWIGI